MFELGELLRSKFILEIELALGMMTKSFGDRSALTREPIKKDMIAVRIKAVRLNFISARRELATSGFAVDEISFERSEESLEAPSTSAFVFVSVELLLLPVNVEVTVAFAKALLTAVEAPLNLDKG